MCGSTCMWRPRDVAGRGGALAPRPGGCSLPRLRAWWSCSGVSHAGPGVSGSRGLLACRGFRGDGLYDRACGHCSSAGFRRACTPAHRERSDVA